MSAGLCLCLAATDASLRAPSVTVDGKFPALLLNVNNTSTATRLHQVHVVCFVLQMGPDSAPAVKLSEQVQGSSVVPIHAAPKAVPPKVLQGAIPSGHIPKPVILPDYIA